MDKERTGMEEGRGSREGGGKNEREGKGKGRGGTGSPPIKSWLRA